MEIFSYRWWCCPHRVVRFESFSSLTYSLAIVVFFSFNFGFFLTRISPGNVNDVGDDIFLSLFFYASLIFCNKRSRFTFCWFNCIKRAMCTPWYVCRVTQYQNIFHERCVFCANGQRTYSLIFQQSHMCDWVK